MFSVGMSVLGTSTSYSLQSNNSLHSPTTSFTASFVGCLVVSAEVSFTIAWSIFYILESQSVFGSYKGGN